MSKLFKIKEGIYVQPGFSKKIDTRKELSDEDVLKLYTETNFPFISPTEAAVAPLKKLKLGEKGIAKLVAKAKSLEELEILAKLSEGKALQSIIVTAKQKFHK